MTINLLEPTPQTIVPVGNATYSDDAVWCVATLVAQRMKPLPFDTITPEVVQTIIQELAPWQPVTDKGRVTKRIVNHIFRQYNAILDEKTLTHIGNYLATDLPSKALLVDVVKDFNWNQGEFGDYGSCFFASGTMALLSKSKAHALRFFSSPKKGEGRVIVLPSSVGEAVLINAYGPSLHQVASRMRVLRPDTPMTLANVTTDSRLYINHNTGLVIGLDQAPHEAIRLPFSWPRMVRHPYSRLDNISADEMVECKGCRTMRPAGEFGSRVNGIVCCQTCGEAAVRCFYSEYMFTPDRVVQVLVSTGEPGRVGSRHPTRELKTVARDYIGSLTRCSTCEASTLNGGFNVSIGGEAFPNMCPACCEERKLISFCSYCGRLKPIDETCVCRKARPNARQEFTYTNTSTEPQFSYVSNTVSTTPSTGGVITYRGTDYTANTTGLERLLRRFYREYGHHFGSREEWNEFVRYHYITNSSVRQRAASIAAELSRLPAQTENTGDVEGGEAGPRNDEAGDAATDGVVRPVGDDAHP